MRIFFVWCAVLIQALSALQAQSTHKALSAFVSGEFMTEVSAFREKVMLVSQQAKAQSAALSVEQQGELAAQYSRLSGQYNGVLQRIKSDLMSASVRKIMAKNPDIYAKSLEADMLKIEQRYTQEYLPFLNRTAFANVEQSPAWLLLAGELIAALPKAVELLSSLQKDWRSMKEENIDRELIQRFSLPVWGDL